MPRNVTLDIIEWRHLTLERRRDQSGNVFYSVKVVVDVKAGEITKTETIHLSSKSFPTKVQNALADLDAKALARIKNKFGV